MNGLIIPSRDNDNDNDDNDDVLIPPVHNVVKVELPNLKYGYRTERMTWIELVHIVQVEQNLDKLSRSIKQQKEYEIFRYNVQRQYKSIIDYILITKFQFAKIKKEQTNKQHYLMLWEARPKLQDITTVQKVLVVNDFPYYTEQNIVHYVLWKTKEDITQEDIDSAIIELKDKLVLQEENNNNTNDNNNILYWINPIHLKSLPEIDHVHFLCLFSKEDPKNTKNRNQKR